MGVFDRLRRRGIERAAGDSRQGWLGWTGSYKPNWWQLGYPVAGPGMGCSAVYTCVSIISEEIARLDIKHWRDLPGGGREQVTTSPAAKVLRRPNQYQTTSDFMLGLMGQVLILGAGYATAQRDRANRIAALYPQDARSASPQIDPQTGLVYYDVSPNMLSGSDQTRYSSLDVLAVRAFTEPGTLVGISPLRAAAFSVDHKQQMQAQQTEFFKAHARPDGILTTDARLTEPQVKRLQESWKDSFSGSKVGNTAVMEGNLKWQPLTLTADDMKLIESLNWSIDDICRIYRVPLWMVNRTDASTYNNVETLGRVFVMMTLGFWVNHVEQALDVLFNLPPGEHIKFSVEAGLMRSEFGPRIDALRTAVQGGIYSPNEARLIEQLPPVDGGDEVFLQKQMEPVDQRAEPAEPEPEPVSEPEPTPMLDEMIEARSRIEDLETEIARQRLEHASEAGALRVELERVRGGD